MPPQSTPKRKGTARRICNQCGIEFWANQALVRLGGGLFCSRSCFRTYRAEHAIDRFWEKVDRSGGPDACWLWTASTRRKGYGQFALRNNKPIPAHRAIWIMVNGEIPDGLCVLHRCDVPGCVNPAHLFLGTKRDNSVDMAIKGRVKNQYGSFGRSKRST